MRDMEIGIREMSDGTLLLHSTHPAFEAEYGEGREIRRGALYSIMLDLAIWANNEIEVGCMFYMD